MVVKSSRQRQRMVSGNGLFYPIIGFASCFAFMYLSFGDLWPNYPREPQLSFVQRNGTHFILDGRVFYINGWNSYWLMDHAVDEYRRPRIRAMLQAGAKMGLTVCRTWAFNDGVYNALQISPGQYDERVFKALDHVIAEARQHGVRLLLSLVNNLQAYGGKTQYVKWAWEEGIGLSSSNDSFFFDPSIRHYFKNHVKTLLTRKNTITGTKYKDDPTIFAWELINEPRCMSDPSGDTLQDWIEEMSTYVKSIDKNHLVTVGLEGFYGPKSPKRLTVNPGEWAAELGSDFIRNSKISTIDFASVHIYPDHWFHDQELEEKLKYVSKWMVFHIEDGDEELKKPVTFTEFGLSNLNKGFKPSQRDQFYKIIYDIMYKSSKRKKSGAGSFVWQFLVGGMEKYNDDFGIVPWERPATYQIITEHSCRLAAIQGVLPSQKDHLKELCLPRQETQADEAFPDAWHLDAAGVSGDGVANIRSKVYLSPKLWYLRVNVIEAQDLQPSDTNRPLEVFVKVVFGNVVMKSKISQNKNVNPMWNEDLMFVAAEPFEEELVVSVEDRVAPNKDEVLGKCRVLLQNVEKRTECECVNSKWYNIEKQEGKVVGRIHTRISLDGGYHVLDELTQYSSDLRATTKQLCKPGIGVFELGILSAQGLSAMKKKDGRGTADAYCVAKYGQKWIRTRTIIDSFNPKWNEQYTWEVFDHCTAITIVVFDNCHLQDKDGAKDARIGKVRIRLSMLESDRVYTHSYPLIVLHSNGVKKMGEIQLAVRFTYSSLYNMLQLYAQPLLPKVHYLHPLSVFQQDSLRHQATQIIAMRMSRAEPPLRKEVVEYMLDVGSHMWSMRKSKANICRIIDVLSGLATVNRWFDEIRLWNNPFKTVFIHIWCLIIIIHPKMIFTTILLSLFLVGLLNYRKRPRHPPHMDARLSHADTATVDELDEEFDSFPSSRQADVLKTRYDRLRCIAARMQTVVGDLATQGERFHSLLSWRDPRATALFMISCLVAAVVLWFTPIQGLCVLLVLYVLRHPRFRDKLHSSPFNFFRRLPTKADSLL